jgi:hypothetical protein
VDVIMTVFDSCALLVLSIFCVSAYRLALFQRGSRPLAMQWWI